MDLGLCFFNGNLYLEYWYKIFSKEGFRICYLNVVILIFDNDFVLVKEKNSIYDI